MHNIDRTVGESSYEMNPEYSGEYEFEAQGEYEFEGEGEYEFEGEGEYEFEGEGEFEFEGEYEFEGELSSEAMEMELATELLNVSNEGELEQFLGGLISKAAGAVKSFANSSAGRAVGGFLKSAAKKALPIVGKAAGAYFGGPLGAQIGGQLGSYASNLFELELEGLSNEDKEFELSRAYVRFANDAVRRAARNPRSRTHPRQAARNAVIASAQRNAPGLLRKRRRAGRRGNRSMVAPAYPPYGNYNIGTAMADQSSGNSQAPSGSWYRKGNQIILNL